MEFATWLFSVYAKMTFLAKRLLAKEVNTIFAPLWFHFRSEYVHVACNEMTV